MTEIHHRHRDVGGGWLRPAVFGAMDGYGFGTWIGDGLGG